MNPFRPISISLSPNVEKDDLWLAFSLIFKPWLWREENFVRELENKFKQYFSVKYAFGFNSGRTALFAILESLEIKDSDVLLQAFTCNAASNPIIWSGNNPIYVDCNEEDFNIDSDILKNKITPKSKAVILQHTFGLPADIDKIAEVAKRNNLTIIEDCAHSLGAEYKGKKVGTFGRASFFSFSRDKILSSVYGGMVITNDDELAKKISKFQKSFDKPSSFWTLQQLLHPILMNFIILPTYNFLKIGKIILLKCQWFKILSKAVHWKEKRGLMPNYFPKKMPGALAILALNQFDKLERFNSHRRNIAKFYYRNLEGFSPPKEYEERKSVFLRFTVKTKNAHSLIKSAWKNNILIGDWYTSPIAPNDTQLDKVRYIKGSCPVAEELSKSVLNLPTHINISKKEAKKVVSFLNEKNNSNL